MNYLKIFIIFLVCTFNIAKSQTNCPLVSITNLQVVTGSASNLVSGNRLKSVGVIVYNGIAYDAVFEIKTVAIGTGATLAVSGTSNLLIRNAKPSDNPYVTYSLAFVPTGTDVTSGPITPTSLPNISITQSDIDGNNVATFSDIGGFSNSNPGTPSIVVGANLVNSGFLAGGPTGFSLYRASALSNTCNVSVTNTTPTNLAYGVVITYSTFTSGDFIFGETGCTSSTTAIGERAQNIFVNAPYSCPNAPTADDDASTDNNCTNNVVVNILSGDFLDGNIAATPDKVKVNFTAPTTSSTINGNVRWYQKSAHFFV